MADYALTAHSVSIASFRSATDPALIALGASFEVSGTVAVTLTNPSGRIDLSNPSQTIVRVGDDDQGPITSLQFRIVEQGTTDTRVMVIERDQVADVLLVPLDANGKALSANLPAASDYTAAKSFAQAGGIDITAFFVNNAPVAVNDRVTTFKGQAVVLDLVSNDSDADGDVLSASVGSVANGSVAQVGGDLVFTPTAGFVGETTFTYQLSDGNGGTDTAVVTLVVRDLKDFATEGPDTIFGTAGPDEMIGLGGNDLLYGLSSADSLSGDAGDDSLFGGSGDDALYGGGGSDRLQGGSNADELFGGSGSDLLQGGSGKDGLYGGGGADRLEGGGGKDTIKGGGGKDSLAGGSGRDKLEGQGGSDKINGNGGNDTLKGGSGKDNLNGGGGNDKLVGGGGNDRLAGGSGKDTLQGNGGNDRLKGDGGKDTLKGGGGKDILQGNGGDDRLEGGNGADKLTGGNGDDILKGGGSADTFVFDRRDGNDRINDFKHGTDSIEIKNGAKSYDDLNISQQGDHVVITFARTEILIRDDLVAAWSADDFSFG